MIKVGITGGIGSGKTTVCRIFELLGIPIYYADDRAKWLMNNDPQLKEQLIALLGNETYTKEGQLNRAYVSNIIFNNKEKLEGINSIVHPAVWKDGEAWNQEHAHAPYTLKEAALLYESGGYHLMDKMITVYAPKDIRLERVMKRDNASKDAVLARMDKQMSDDKKMELADFIIHNYNKNSLLLQVLDIHFELQKI